MHTHTICTKVTYSQEVYVAIKTEACEYQLYNIGQI